VSNAGGITISDFKLYYRTIITKTEWHWQKTRHVNQWNKRVDPEITVHRLSHLILQKGIRLRKTASSTNGSGKENTLM
jgi:hypothetical protein